MLHKHILPFFIWVVYRTLVATWRITIIESDGFQRALKERGALVMAHFHGDILGVIHMMLRYRVATIVSSSKDGDLITGVIHWLGGKSSRGSSTRGGVNALKGLLRLTRDGYCPCVAVDGPKGPFEKAKSGVFEVARLTNLDIFPVSFAASNAFVFKKAWDKSTLPLPFSRVVVVWGDAIPGVTRDSDSRDPQLAERLEKALLNARQQARNLIATK